MAALAEHSPDEVGTRLAEQWIQTRARPTVDEVLDALRISRVNDDRARVVCLGTIEVPEPEDLHVEPQIIPFSRLLARWRDMILLMMFIMLAWALSRLGIAPSFLRIRMDAVSVIIVLVGLATSIIWLWRSLVRPRYIRIAPGILQVLEFGVRRRKPDIWSYPMEAGTVVVVCGEGQGLTLTFSKPGQRDRIPIGQMKQPEQQLQRIWPALLSTAPTPPLSDEALLG